MKIKNVSHLIISIIICQSAGIIGSIFTTPAIPIWYASLNKPSFTPPSWLFGPVWLLLYTLMGISLYLIWQKGLENKKVKSAFLLFLINLVFNSLWSVLFFGFKNPQIALVDILLVWVLIIILMLRFLKIDKIASYLLIPYLLWVSFATALNFSIWQLNK